MLLYFSLGDKVSKVNKSPFFRKTWKDEFMTWDPNHYSGVQTINVDSAKVWKPDVVLYNRLVSDSILLEIVTIFWYFNKLLFQDASKTSM